MSSDNEGISEIKEKLKSIENRLKKLERGSISDLEHQLFFGVIFSLLVLFVTVEPSQIANIFHNVGFSQDSAIETALLIKNWGTILTFLSATTRYYSALIKDEIRKSSRWRLISILLAVMSFELFLFFIAMNATLQLPGEISWMSLPLKLIVLFVIYRSIMFFVEKKLLSFYASKKLILKQHVEPVVSIVFFLLASASYFAVLIYLVIFLVQGFFSAEIFLAIFIMCCLSLLVPYLMKSRKRLI